MRWLVATSYLFVLTRQCRQAQGKLGGDFSSKRDKKDKTRVTTNGEEIFPRLRSENGKTNRQLQSLIFYGKTPDPERLPLGLCEGDCDDDDDCDIGLVCFQRDPGVPVPGCIGNDSDQNNYCVVDTTAQPTSQPTTSQPSTMPTVQTTAPTSQPTTTQPSITPTVHTTAPTSQPSTTQPTVFPTSAPVIVTSTPRVASYTASYTLSTPPVNFANTSPTATGISMRTAVAMEKLEVVGGNNQGPFGLCEGDCDNDDDCEGTLICYQRDAGEDVPGCLGGRNDASRTDYCILPQTTNPTISTSTGMPTFLAPTSQPSLPPSPSPSIGVQTTATLTPTIAPSVTLPTDVSAITSIPTIGTTFTDMSAFPAPTSQPSLPPSPSPSVVVLAAATMTPTIAPSVPPAPVELPAPFNDVRLRLYWEQGYFWQESTRERFWCMMSNYRGEPGSGRCWDGITTAPCQQNQVYIAECNGSSRQQFSMTFTSPDQVMIQEAHNDKRCFERVDKEIYLRGCDPSNDMQQWVTSRGGFTERRFELSSPSLPEYCATQQHHPKPGEQVFMQKCRFARDPSVQTSFWMRY